MARIGSVAAALFVGDQFASLYLGEDRVQTVPGKPVVISSAFTGLTSNVIHAPVSDTGGTSVTGYKYFFNGAGVLPTSTQTSGDNLIAGFTQNLGGQVVRMLASNAVGDGPLSAPVTVTT
jgi:hypothetical protein